MAVKKLKHKDENFSEEFPLPPSEFSKSKNQDSELEKTKLRMISSNKNMNSNKKFKADHFSENEIDNSQFEAHTPIDESDTTKTRVNIIQSIKDMVTKKTPPLTNPDETARITILNKVSMKDRLKKWSWIGMAIIAIGILYQSGIFQKKASSDSLDPIATENVENGLTESRPPSESKSKLLVNYNITGRGLVYNCRGNKWACTDKANYINCRKLFKSDRSCSPQGVFDTSSQCQNSLRSKQQAKVDPNICP